MKYYITAGFKKEADGEIGIISCGLFKNEEDARQDLRIFYEEAKHSVFNKEQEVELQIESGYLGLYYDDGASLIAEIQTVEI